MWFFSELLAYGGVRRSGARGWPGALSAARVPGSVTCRSQRSPSASVLWSFVKPVGNVCMLEVAVSRFVPEESAGGRPPLPEQQALRAHRAPSSYCVLTVLPVLVFSRPSIFPIHSSHLLLRVQRARTAWLWVRCSS